MRNPMNAGEFDQAVKTALKPQASPSAEFEADLFAQAEELLANRRAYRAARRSRLAALLSRPGQVWRGAQGISAQVGDFLALRPTFPAAVLSLVILLAAYSTLLRPRVSEARDPAAYAEIPSPAKDNSFPAHYDKQRLADEQAYEREVEDDHRKSSGGL